MTVLGIQVYPDCDRYQKVVDSETQDLYCLVLPAQVMVTCDDADLAALNGLQPFFKTAGHAA